MHIGCIYSLYQTSAIDISEIVLLVILNLVQVLSPNFNEVSIIEVKILIIYLFPSTQCSIAPDQITEVRQPHEAQMESGRVEVEVEIMILISLNYEYSASSHK